MVPITGFLRDQPPFAFLAKGGSSSSSMLCLTDWRRPVVELESGHDSISEGGVGRRAELYYQQFDALAALRQGTRRELLAEARKHPAMRLLRQIPAIGPVRAALLIALMQTPNRFRTKRQLWTYCGLALKHIPAGSTASLAVSRGRVFS